MLKLLGRASSINVRKVLWTLAEIGAAYEHEPWGEGSLSLQSPEFRALNPNGLVPVLQDDGLTLTESNTICRYLAARWGRVDLLPEASTDPGARARVEQWMDWQATELNTAWRGAFMGLVRQHPAYQDPAAIEASVQAWNRQMALLDMALARSGGHVAGAEFTLADIPMGLSVHRWVMTPIEQTAAARPALPHVAAYYERLTERAGFRLYGRNGLP